MEPERNRPGRRVRLEDVARRVGVSAATVSRALAGAPGVRPELRARIREAALACNYAPALALGERQVQVIASAAAMLDHARSQFTLNVMQGLEDRAATLRAGLLTRAAADRDDALAALAAAGRDPAVAGVLLLTLDDAALLDAAAALAKPVVLINGDDPLMRLSSVAPCNRAAAALATDHLLGLGHRRILFLMRRGRRTIERRLEGWRDRLFPDLKGFDPALVVEAQDWLAEAAQAAMAARLAAGGLDFTAVLAAGDSLAIGAARALAAHGAAVPAQVSVMGMDGLAQAAFHDPPLSVIQMPMREIGAAALDLLWEALAGRISPPRRVELACALKPRGSTAAPPGYSTSRSS